MAGLNIPVAWRKRWLSWLDRRIPPARQVELSHRSIFIVPNSVGLLFGAVLLVMLVTAINYQNSLIYALTFWLFSVALAGMHFTYRNLSGLTLAAGHAYPVFAGDVIDVPLRLMAAAEKSHDALSLGFPDNPAITIDVERNDSEQAGLSFRTQSRGWLDAGRLRLETRFPLGMYTAWTWVRLEFNVLVYPRPEWVPFVFAAGDGGEELEGAPSRDVGNQDFNGLRPYQPGDSLKQIAWKQLARGKGLVTKEFDSDQGASCWLDWEVLAPATTEVRLSRLTGWVLQAHQNGWRYGLRLPSLQLAPDNSDLHKEQCLQALALYGLPPRAGQEPQR